MLSANKKYTDPSSPSTYNQGNSVQFVGACRFIDAHGLLINGPVLDIGSGDGKVTAYLADKIQQPVVGVDISSDRVAFAKAHYASSKVKFVVGNALALNDVPELSGQHYQTIVSFYSIHHFPRQQQLAFFQQVRAKLDDDGIALFLMPNGKNKLLVSIRETAASEKWAKYFSDFNFDQARTYEGAKYYSDLAKQANFAACDIQETVDEGVEMDFAGVKKFISGWLPHLAHLKKTAAEVNQDEFLDDIVKHYFAAMVKGSDEKIRMPSVQNNVVLYAGKAAFFKEKKEFQAKLEEAKQMAFGI